MSTEGLKDVQNPEIGKNKVQRYTIIQVHFVPLSWSCLIVNESTINHFTAPFMTAGANAICSMNKYIKLQFP